MPSKYGTGLYGKGNYAALTAWNVTAAQGSFAEAGQVSTLKWQAKLAFAFGSFALTGMAAGFGKIAWSVAIGSFTLAGQAIDFTFGNLWTAALPGATPWIPQIPASDPWAPVISGSSTWTPNL